MSVQRAERFEALLAEDEDLRRLVDGGWIRYRTSPALQELTWDAHATCARINRTYYDDPVEAQRLFEELIPGAGTGIDFRPPISIDYGMRIRIGDRTFINADFLVIGGGLVTIGSDCLIGPRCAIYTPNHAEDLERRLDGWELPEAVTIGNNVWLGGSVTITPGVTIGDNSIIGAGSVVTRDIPAGVVAVGNPCRPVRPIAAAG
ncbi:maltose O-acetyltransferase [Microbacteriaceae bacterium SG_E_30_P1]|uniref:Maltose O-acetyltransferase n=1 Tax=Antiquaquibacter oligotrophicus TaxID=2880260 RepID=A0ABT6KQF7_9MICO|nr:sugar O-acetyltransferase [Antiquaquibacter oligotrophicus]MDH6182203.1 maltose O-acetyltransferase [Antiquaquibacter oligotrophicus]UDF12137.1 sugar O-acetyltransferase [Antiquaquibacter oligotrophicus]